MNAKHGAGISVAPLTGLPEIEPGADLSLVGGEFLHWLLTDPFMPGIDHPLVGCLGAVAEEGPMR